VRSKCEGGVVWLILFGEVMASLSSAGSPKLRVENMDKSCSMPTASEYSAAVARLAQARDTIEPQFKAASDSGDLVEGQRLSAELKREFEAFTAFRDGIPAAVRLSINAERILESFAVAVDSGLKARVLSLFGVKPMETVSLTIPADISDRDAMHALNSKFRELFPEENRAAIWERHIEQILTYGGAASTKRSARREIKVIGVVDGTVRKNRESQEAVLTQKGLVFSHPIDQALAAAAFACKQEGKYLFGNKNVRGSVPGVALRTFQDDGVYVLWDNEDQRNPYVAASGSPSPE
jgi:hypothetical protein